MLLYYLTAKPLVKVVQKKSCFGVLERHKGSEIEKMGLGPRH